MDNDIHSSQFWLDQWRASITGDTSVIGVSFANPSFWDSMAMRYDEGFDDNKRRALNALMDTFEQEGIFSPGMDILDIGCGTGRLAIALAERGGKVTALDSSPQMLVRFAENLPSSLADRVEMVESAWETIDLDARGWRERFDLVTASMTPAITGPDAFLTMLSAGHRGWYYKAWATRDTGDVRAGVWERLKNGPVRDRYAPLFYIFNYLAASGYYPHMFFNEIVHERESTVEQAIRSACAYFSTIKDIPGEELDHIINKVVHDMAYNGIITEKMRGNTGTIMWKKQDVK